MKKLLALLLAVCLVVGCLPLAAGAYDMSGVCGADGDGSNVTWSMDAQNGTLTIRGMGKMKNGLSSPWSWYGYNPRKVIIEEGVTSIGSHAFAYCENIISVSIPDSVTEIGGSAFLNCSSLANITIPGSVTLLGGYTNPSFNGCVGLKTAGPIGGGYDYEFGWTEQIPASAFACTGLKEITIPNSVTEIYSHAFSACTNLTNIDIPKSVKRIWWKAFSNCINLTNITIPSSVADIGDDVFTGCTNLKTAGPIGGGFNCEFGWETAIPKSAFSGCESLRSVVIPHSIVEIGNSAFLGCVSLSNIDIPVSVTKIGNDAFHNCKSLKSVVIPNSIKTISNGTFKGCDSLASVVIAKSVTEIGENAFWDCTGLTSISIPDSVTRIGSHAFLGCTSLKSLVMPSSVNKIGENVFSDTKLTSAGPIGGGYDYEFGWTEKIPSRAFGACNNLMSVTIPNSVTEIGSGAFAFCTSLPSVTIPDSVTEIASDMFYGSISLRSITIPDSVIKIGEWGFRNCTSLTSVTIPASVVTIKDCAYYGCTSLTSVAIPLSVKEIWDSAFFECTNLTDVYYAGSKQEWERIIARSGNEPLLNATIHYNSTGGADVPVVPTPSPGTGETETISLPFYSGIGNKNNEIPVAWSWDLFHKPAVTSTPYKSYDNTLATTGLILSTAAEQSEEKCRSILVDKLKCDSYGHANYDDSSDLHPAISFACKKRVIEGKEEYIFTVVARGTESGNLNDLWTDISSFWAGFDSPANNLYGQLGMFMGTTDLPDSDIPIGGGGRVKFFVTGHSLGGAMANIIAKKLSDVYGKENVFSYTFATPFVIDSSATSNTVVQGNIYNILHEEDIVPLLPPTLSDRYGLPVWFSRDKFNGMYNNFSNLTNGKTLEDRLAPTNLSPFKGHDTEIYLSFLQTLSSGVPLPQVSYTGGGGGGGAWCPVDLEIYMETSNGSALVGRVRDNVIDESVTKNVVIRVKGDRKYFYFPYEGNYSIKLTGTDTDVMTFFIQEMDYSTGEPIDGTGKVFEKVILEPGKEMTTQVNVINQLPSGTDTSNVKLFVLDAAGQPEKEVLPDGNGTEIPITPDETWNTPFHDVAEGTWYYDAVRFAYQNSLMSGTSANTFAPNTRLSRAMLAQILYNKEGKPQGIDGKDFPDVAAGTWYANAVKWAGAQGIVAGYGDGRFGPEDDITREQLATMLWRYDGSQQVADTQLDFRDAGEISSYAKTAMQWAVKNGVIGGKGNKVLDPKGFATRAEVAQILKNYLS